MFGPGDRIGNYEVVQRLSAGGMATLYLCKRVGAAGFSRPVALKVIHPNLADDEEFATMFVGEAILAARISHPNVVHVEELGQLKKDKTFFLAMEFVHGRSLAQLVKALGKIQLRTSAELAVAIVAQAAAGLHAAHETRGDDGKLLGVVHRDVTPHNVLVSFDGHVKVIDFGIAKSKERAQNTRSGVLKGTVRFMSPEQARGEPLDRRSDIFSLGILLWELLTLKKLFEGRNDLDIVRKLRAPRVEAPSAHGGPLNPMLDTAVLTALGATPDDRPATALELRRMLIDAVPSALTIDAVDIAALMEKAFPAGERVSSPDDNAMTLRPASGAAARSHSVRPPDFGPLTSSIDDAQVDVDALFSDVDRVGG